MSMVYKLQVKFFTTYVLTSGWTSLACEVAQLWPLLCNIIYKVILRKDHGPFDGEYTFPYQSEVPRVLLFGLLGLNFAILAPLILPLLLVYFCLAYLVYRNQVYFLLFESLFSFLYSWLKVCLRESFCLIWTIQIVHTVDYISFICIGPKYSTRGKQGIKITPSVIHVFIMLY